ncbi:MAG: peptidoglycan-binding protein [Cyanobacteria bacterium P01_A01_bin.80]
MNRFALKSSKWILSAALVCSIVGVASSAQAQVFRQGSRGVSVTTIQNALKSHGFMSPSINSTEYFGPMTREAVRNFQRSRGLRADGVVGYQTLRAMGLTGTGGSYAGNYYDGTINRSPAGVVRVNSYLNVRYGPSTGYGVRRTLRAGNAVPIFEQQGSWYRISDGNEWVHSRFIERTR